MAEFNQIKSLQNFLEQDIFQSPINLQQLHRGGNSINFMARTVDADYLVKLLPLDLPQHNRRICDILECFGLYPDFYTAHLCHNVPQACRFENYQVIITNFIHGHKLKYYQLTADMIRTIAYTYRQFNQVDFSKYDFVMPQQMPNDLYQQNKEELLTLTQHKNRHISRMAEILMTYNQKFYDNMPSCSQNLNVIHGDASLNNMIFDNGKIAFLDLELMRFGYVVEDAAELILASLLPHYIFMSPQKRLKQLISAVNQEVSLTPSDWEYGIRMHFLYYLRRRIRGGKLFKSYRKDWLVVRYLKKFDLIMKWLKSGDFAI